MKSKWVNNVKSDNKIYEINDVAKSILTETFEVNEIPKSDFVNEIKEQDRYAQIIKNVFGEGNSQIGMGLYFGEAPHLILWLWAEDRTKGRKGRNSKMASPQKASDGILIESP